jgi:hypothetical protein
MHKALGLMPRTKKERRGQLLRFLFFCVGKVVRWGGRGTPFS